MTRNRRLGDAEVSRRSGEVARRGDGIKHGKAMKLRDTSNQGAHFVTVTHFHS